MAGIYIHIPFCRKACVYCDFHFSTNLSKVADMVEAIKQEAIARTDFFSPNTEIETIYLGGGTPSILQAQQLQSLLQTIQNHYPIAASHETTLEANPDDLSLEVTKMLAAVGINRLSIGIQSFREKDLRWMNRSHNSQQIYDSIQFAREAGIENISVDLIFGLPDLGLDEWAGHVRQVIDLQLPHLSVYALTVEEKTALAYQLRKEQTQLPEDPLYNEQFLLAHQLLVAAGYDHYELSNYALPGSYSRHNSAYWKQLPYLGLGPSAHSFDGSTRYWNLRNNQRYLQAIAHDQLPIEDSEILSKRDRYHEYVMTQLRKKEGIDIKHINTHFVEDWEDHFRREVQQLLQTGDAIREGDFLRLSPAAWMLSDEIIREFFVDSL